MIRRPPRSTLDRSSAASDVYKRQELTLTPVQGGTLMSLLITYPNKELRDMILGTGMTTGMEASYVRLEREVLGLSLIHISEPTRPY
mgnify:CR=1 FL=1